MDSKEIFNEVNKILLKTTKPSYEIKRLIKEGKFNKPPFNKIKQLENINQNPIFHPEGNVLNHTFLVIDKASEVKNLAKDKKVFMWSALLHDIGKLTTTKIRKNRITSYNHDTEGAEIGIKFLEEVSDDKKFNLQVSKLIKWHMQPLFYDKNLPFFQPQNMLNDVEYKEVALLSFCDRLGRGNLSEETIIKEKERIKLFENYCSKIKD